MSQIFGEFIEEFPLEHDCLELSFTSSSQLSKRQWRNIRLSANFVGDYFSTLLPDEPNSDRIIAMKNTVSYVCNELLENAIKFNEDIKHYQVKFGIRFLADVENTAVIFTKNTVTAPRVEKFQTFIQELLSGDPQELYVQQIEKTAADENSDASGLGLLTLINDYSAKLGWKFESEPTHPQITMITTTAQVVV